MYKYLLQTLLFIILLINNAFTQTDRERLIKIDERLIKIDERLIKVETEITVLKNRFEDYQKHNDRRIDDLHKRLDDQQSTQNTQFVVLCSMILALFGYIIWDRRTAQRPMEQRLRTLENTTEKIQQSYSILKP